MKPCHHSSLAYLCQDIAYVIIAFLEVLNTTVRETLPVPAVVDDHEAQVEALTQVKQVVGLLTRPVVIGQVLLVFHVGVHWDVYCLLVKKLIA